MVAHSAGAFVAPRFADRHSASMAGMVLVDPAIPDEAAVRERVAPKFAALGDGAPRAATNRLRQCAARLQIGALTPGTPAFDECTSQPSSRTPFQPCRGGFPNSIPIPRGCSHKPRRWKIFRSAGARWSIHNTATVTCP